MIEKSSADNEDIIIRHLTDSILTIKKTNFLQMKTTFLFSVLILLICNLSLNAQKSRLLPAPQSAKWGTARFNVAGAKLLVSPELALREEKSIAQFISFVKDRTGLSLTICYFEDPKAQLIVLNSDQPGSPLPSIHEKPGAGSREAYGISVSANKVQVKAYSDAGLYYALQTLRQLITVEGGGSYIPEVDIDDYPAFAYRGVMIDFSHGGLLNEQEIKNQIDFLARWKINQYYFYNEVSIEMKGYPLINYNACYSQEQIKRIIAYGRERHMDVIPFVNLYGHLHELLRVEKYAGLGIGHYGHDLNPNEPAVQSTLKDWIKQYADLFPSPFIHIGFDETWETERLSIADATIKPKELYIKQITFVTNTLREYGKTMMAWTDITHNYPTILSEFPKDVIPVVWDYSDDSTSVSRWIKPILKEKLPFFIQPAVDGWAHIYPTKYTYDNIDLCLKAGIDKKAIGYITSVWTDAVQPLLRNSWLFMAYGCIEAWQGSVTDRNEFIGNYSKIVYPDISDHMNIAFQKMAESQAFLEKCLRRHTQTEMWTNPFSDYNLQHTKDNFENYKKARIASESAIESLINAYQCKTTDTLFIKSLLVNSRLLHYTATRFLWAKLIVDRWNQAVQLPGNKYISSYNDIKETPHGLIADIVDYCTELKEEYKQAWLSENMPYRLGTMTGRFDEEYLLWRGLAAKLVEYHYNGNKKQPAKFKDIFATR